MLDSSTPLSTRVYKLIFGTQRCAMNVHAFHAAPFFKPPSFAEIAGVVISGDADWDETGALLQHSWRHVAPKRALV